MLEKSVRICDAKFGNIYRWEGDAFTSWRQTIRQRRSPKRAGVHRFVLGAGTLSGRMVATKVAVHVADFAAQEGYTERRDPAFVAAANLVEYGRF